MNNSQHCKVGYKYKKLTKLTYFFKCPISYSNHKSSCNIPKKIQFQNLQHQFLVSDEGFVREYKCQVIKNDSKLAYNERSYHKLYTC